MLRQKEQFQCLSKKCLIKYDQTKIRLHFPFLTPTNLSFTSYDGFIEIQGQEFFLKVKTPHYPSLTGLTFEIYNGVRLMLPNINQNQTLHRYLLEVQSHLSNIVQKKKKKISNNFQIIDDMNHILNENHNFKASLNRDLNEIKIQNIFHYENHFCIIKRQVAGLYKIVSHSLPDLPISNNLEICKDVKKLIDNFLEYLVMLEKFYSDLDEIDLLCWVIDPEKPTSKENFRRIIIGDNCSILITLSPWSYGAVPNLTLMGPNRVTDDIRDCISRNIADWDENVSLYRNLLHVLEIVFFPKKPEIEEISNENQDELLLIKECECCICFSDRLNGKLPSIVCENSRCSLYFHSECLYEWLSSLPASHQKWGFIKGVCPNCCESISCEIPNNL